MSNEKIIRECPFCCTKVPAKATVCTGCGAYSETEKDHGSTLESSLFTLTIIVGFILILAGCFADIKDEVTSLIMILIGILISYYPNKLWNKRIKSRPVIEEWYREQ
jgi:hypothetical protein